LTPEPSRPQDTADIALPETVRRAVPPPSWASPAAERLYPVVWPAGGVVGAFVVLALANGFAYLPVWLDVAVLSLFLGGTAWARRGRCGSRAGPDPRAGSAPSRTVERAHASEPAEARWRTGPRSLPTTTRASCGGRTSAGSRCISTA
jgi:hypothetical protein